jgi:tRNA modification GTPase
LRDTDDPVEKIGVERTVEAFSEADLVLVVLDGAAGIDDNDRSILDRVSKTAHRVVLNKCDLVPLADLHLEGQTQAIRVSAKTGDGMEALIDAIRAFLAGRAEGASHSIMTSARQFENVSRAVAALDKAMAATMENTPQEMVLLDIYAALSELNELTGDVVTEDILGRIFSTFCVGK